MSSFVSRLGAKGEMRGGGGWEGNGHWKMPLVNLLNQTIKKCYPMKNKL